MKMRRKRIIADIVGNAVEGAQVGRVSLDFVYLVNEGLFEE